MSSVSPDPRHAQLSTWYEQLTARIKAADKDIGRAPSELDRQVYRERLADLLADREIVTAYLDALERGHPLPGPWPPDLKTADLLAAPPPRILFKSGRCDFYRHIPLPPNYIPRPELLSEVRERLIGGTGGLALTSAIQVKQADVLHGMGGIGKSVLARALCDDPDMQAAFPDGILWATLGQTPDLTARLREWIETLGGVVGQIAPTLDQLRNTLAEALRDKACLLIADDAWRKAHLEPFCAGGPRCRLLITTRDAALTEGLDAGIYPVPVMALDQAVALLEEWAGVEVETEVKAEIVRRLGCLPLAVRLAGAQLRTKNPTEWLANFDARKLKTRRVEAVHDSLEATFDLSLDALSPADRRLYVALAIFKEDEPIPVVAIARLWSALGGRDAGETRELLDDLAAQALLARDRGDGDAVTFHDLLRDFTAAELGNEGRIAALRTLLDAYRQTQQGSGWHTTPDDGYLYAHLTYHLDQLADHDLNAVSELSNLFASQDWLSVRVPQCGYRYDGYLSDLRAIWRRAQAQAHRQVKFEQHNNAFADCYRYALIAGTVSSMAVNLTPDLLASAVRGHLWSVERALSLTAHVKDAEQRTALYIGLLSTIGPDSTSCAQASREGMNSALQIRSATMRAEGLTKLIPFLSGESRALALAEGLAAALSIEHQRERLRAISSLTPHLTEQAKSVALESALETIAAIRDRWDLIDALTTVAPSLPVDLLARAISIVRECQVADLRAKGLAALVPCLPMHLHSEVLLAMREFSSEHHRATVLCALAPYLQGTMLAQTRAEAQDMTNTYRAQLLAALAPRVGDDLRLEALETALTIENPTWRIERLLELIPQLPGDQRETAVSAILDSISDCRGHHLNLAWRAALIPALHGPLLARAVEIAIAHDDEWIQSELLAALAPRLEHLVLGKVLDAALRIKREWNRAHALAALTPFLDQGQMAIAVKASSMLTDRSARVRCLVDMACSLSGELQTLIASEALIAARDHPDPWERARLLVRLIRSTTGELQAEALAVLLSVENETLQRDSLVALLPTLHGHLATEALSRATAVRDESAQALALAKVTAQVLDNTDHHMTRRVLRSIRAVQNEGKRSEALCSLIPHLNSCYLDEAQTIAVSIRDPWSKANALAALLLRTHGHEQGRILREGLATATAIKFESSRAVVLCRFLEQGFTEEKENPILAELSAIVHRKLDETWQFEVTAGLAQHLEGKAQETLLNRAATAAMAIRDPYSSVLAISMVAPKLPNKERTRILSYALKAAAKITSERQRSWALIEVAPLMENYLRNRALVMAQAISDEHIRAEALAAFAPELLRDEELIASVRHAMIDSLWMKGETSRREDVLMYCTAETLFCPPVLPPETLAAIARHIIEICQEWEWL